MSEAGILLSILGFEPSTASWIRLAEAEFGRIPGAVATLHLVAPDLARVDGETRETFQLMNRSDESKWFRIWSGGWSGAPAVLLFREELEWDIRWSESNEDRTGLEQLLHRPVEAYAPHRPTPAQVVRLAGDREKPVCGGYPYPPQSGQIQPVWEYRDGRWRVAPALYLERDSLESSRRFPAPDHLPPEPFLLHLALSAETLPEPTILVDRILELLDTGSSAETEVIPVDAVFREARDEELDHLPSQFESALPASMPAPLQLITAAAATQRHSARLNRDRIADTLRTLSPYFSGSAASVAGVRPDRGSYTPEEFQGSTEGHLTLQEGSLTVRFASGRLAGISDASRGESVRRRALGYVREHSGVIPRVSYLRTDHAAWFTGNRYRGVEERATMTLHGTDGEGLISMTTTTVVSEQFPGVLLGYALTFPENIPRVPLSIAMFQIPLAWHDPDSPAEVKLIDGDGVHSTATIPPGPGRWTVITSLLRVPLEGGGLWIGSLDPGSPAIVPMQIERTATDQGALLSVEPVFHFHGVLPPDLAGNTITGSLVLVPGERPPGDLKIPREAERYLRYFSRTVPA